MKETIKQILMRRDGKTSQEAQELIDNARADFFERLEEGEQPHEICAEWFGLEPDYIMELI